MQPVIQVAFSLGRAQITVSSVYWGTAPSIAINARPGDTNIPLSIVLSNVGDDVARAVSARLELTPPFLFEYFKDGERRSSSSVTQNAGDIAAGLSRTLVFTLTIMPDAAEGMYRLPLVLEYSSARELQQVTSTQNVDVPVWRGSLHIQRIVTVPEKIYPGSIGVLLKVWVVNTGQGAERDVEVTLDMKGPFKQSSSSSNRVFLGTIQPYQASLAEFRLDVDENSKPGDHSLLLLSAVGKATPAPLGSVSLYVNEKAKLEVVKVSPTEMTSGDTGVTVTLLIKNVAQVTAKSVRVQLRPGNYFSGVLSDFLGTIGPGEERTAFFTVDVDSKAPAMDYKIDLRLEWTQDETSLTDTVPVVFKLNWKPPILQFAAPLAALALLIFMFVLRRKKAEKPTARP
jgi:hypothetical protein